MREHGPEADAEREEINTMLHHRGFRPPIKPPFAIVEPEDLEPPELFSLSPPLRRQKRTVVAEKTSQISLPTVAKPVPEKKVTPASHRRLEKDGVTIAAANGMVRNQILMSMHEQRQARMQEEAVRIYVRKARQLNEIGIFEPSVNHVRAKMMATSEVIRRVRRAPIARISAPMSRRRGPEEGGRSDGQALQA